ncbi:MAG: hypothetical protein RL660_2260 [Bacteroidota bacterium]|jgi:DNA ligase-1
MKAFAALHSQLELNSKDDALVISALLKYFASVSDVELPYVIWVLCGKKPKRLLTQQQAQAAAMAICNTPVWLFETSVAHVGNVPETIALLLAKDASAQNQTALSELLEEMIAIGTASLQDKKHFVQQCWQTLAPESLFLFSKLVCGTYRSPISKVVLSKALASHFDVDEHVVQHLLVKPSVASLREAIVLLKEATSSRLQKPFELCKIDLQAEPNFEALGDIADWHLTYLYGGVRCQIVVDENATAIYTATHELITAHLPELQNLHTVLPSGTIIDAEIISFNANHKPHAALVQKRLEAKPPSNKLLQEISITLVVRDLLQLKGCDIRQLSFNERYEILCSLLKNQTLLTLPEQIYCDNWTALYAKHSALRHINAKAIQMQHKFASYDNARQANFAWQASPLHVQAILLYVQPSIQSNGQVLNEYSFAIWHGEELKPFTKATLGLSDDDAKQLMEWVKKNTKEKFGPVRSVNAVQVFELACDDIYESSRHKSGFVASGVRIVAWHKEKAITEASTRQELLEMLTR